MSPNLVVLKLNERQERYFLEVNTQFSQMFNVVMNWGKALKSSPVWKRIIV
jgi:hypothetical protein